MKNEIYLSVDIETDGPNPGQHSMLSFGIVALDLNFKNYGEFERNLELLPNAVPHPDTMKFWSENNEAYLDTRTNLVSPHSAMLDLVSWINTLKKHGTPVLAAYPARFDIKFIDWYSLYFLDKQLCSISALDLKSYVSAVLKMPYMESTKRNMPQRWFSKLPHTHKAIDDAREQGHLIINVLRENLGFIS